MNFTFLKLEFFIFYFSGTKYVNPSVLRPLHITSGECFYICTFFFSFRNFSPLDMHAYNRYTYIVFIL